MIVLQEGNQKLFNNNTDNSKKFNEKILPTFIAESPLMQLIYRKIKALAYTKTNVLILGDRGTGRYSTAYQIFYQCNDNQKEFIQIDCKTATPHSINQQLFGDKSLKSNKPLLFSNNKNFIYIKNIDLLNFHLQEKLYHYLSNKKNQLTQPRLIFASNEKISKKIQVNSFSQKLFNLISQDLIILPRLSERQKDIFFLISMFNKENAFKGKFNQKAINFLTSYAWYGNISELKKVCMKLSILYPNKDLISEKDLSYIIKDISFENTDIQYNPNLNLSDIINRYTEQALLHFKCKKACASALGISSKTLYNKIKTGAINDFSD